MTGNVGVGSTGRVLGAKLVETLPLAKYPQDHKPVYLRNSGSREMKVDGSGTPVMFKFTAPAGKLFYWTWIGVQLMAETTNLDQFGTQETPLVNGLTLKVYDADDAPVRDMLDGEAICCLGDFDDISAIRVDTRPGPQLDQLAGNALITDLGAAVLLNPGGYVGVAIRDNLTAIIDRLRVKIYGLYLPL